MKTFWGKNFGVILLAKNYPDKEIVIEISNTPKIPRNFDTTHESDFWIPMTKDVVENKTKFGRMGIFFDRKNIEAHSFYNELAKNEFKYFQKNSRAEKQAKFSKLESQILLEIANEGLSDSVEFRGILRKYIKNAKNLHLDSVLFLEGIFAEKKNRQIIEKITGTQIKTYFITDYINKERENETCLQNPAKKTFLIKTTANLSFTKKRAEQVLQRKLKSSDVIKFN